MFKIHLGVPEMEELWNMLEKKHQSGSATKAEEKLRRQMGKAMVLLSGNPRHPGLHSHEITSLTARYGQKVWESYLENDTPKAGRIFWCYGPDKAASQSSAWSPIRTTKPTVTEKLHCQP